MVYKQDGAFYGFTKRVYYAAEKDKLVESDFDKNKFMQVNQIEMVGV